MNKQKQSKRIHTSITKDFMYEMSLKYLVLPFIVGFIIGAVTISVSKI